MNMQTAEETITPRWLTHRLRRNGYLSTGEVTAVRITKAMKHHVALAVDYTDDASDIPPQDLILKWYGAGHPHGVREGLFYEQIAPATPAAPVATWYDVHIDGESKECHVLLQDLSATHYVAQPPYDGLHSETLESVLTAQLAIHAYWWNHPRIAQDDILRGEGIGVAHGAISPQTIRANEQLLLENVLPARIEQLRERFPVAWCRLCRGAIVVWADLFSRRIEESRV